MPEPIPLHPIVCLLPIEQVALSLPHTQCGGFICIKPWFSEVLLVPTIPFTLVCKLQHIKKQQTVELVEPSKSKSKVKIILKDRNSEDTEEMGSALPLLRASSGQVAARKRMQDWSPAMTQENATKGQKDSKSDDEIK